MSRFIVEALFIGAKEGIKLSVCVFMVLYLFRKSGSPSLARPLFAGIGAVFLASFWVMNASVTMALRDVIVKTVGYVFGLFYLFSLAVLFHAGDQIPLFQRKGVQAGFVLLLSVLYFLPDMAGSSLYLSDIFSMSNRAVLVFVFGAFSFGLSLVLSYLVMSRAPEWLTRPLGLPQVLLILSMVKVIAGGVRGFTELSLIPAVQAGLMKLTHDIVHQLLVMLMVPDHPILSVTAWNFIGILFGEKAGLWLSLSIFCIPLIFFLRHHFSEEPPVPSDMRSGAKRRKFIKAFRDERIQKSIPIFLFLAVIISIWFAQKGETGARLYLPEPRPVVAEDGVVKISIQSPAEDLRDGMLHKFSVSAGDDIIRIIVMKRPDGMLAVCLDACEICPPDGYGQGREHVVCLYCNTPIPFDTLGRPGGCNPIPLSALVTDKEIRIPMPEIIEKWGAVKTGKTKENIAR